jgi:catabolite regulation protein CreA
MSASDAHINIETQHSENNFSVVFTGLKMLIHQNLKICSFYEQSRPTSHIYYVHKNVKRNSLKLL